MTIPFAPPTPCSPNQSQSDCVDFHAEATSEKVAMGWYLDGRVTAVLGTHTHVPTADERILPYGTAFQTDVGMSGPYDSIIGVEKDLVLHKFLTGMPAKFEAAKGNPKMCGALVTCDAKPAAPPPSSASCSASEVARPAAASFGRRVAATWKKAARGRVLLSDEQTALGDRTSYRDIASVDHSSSFEGKRSKIEMRRSAAEGDEVRMATQSKRLNLAAARAVEGAALPKSPTAKISKHS